MTDLATLLADLNTKAEKATPGKRAWFAGAVSARCQNESR